MYIRREFTTCLLFPREFTLQSHLSTTQFSSFSLYTNGNIKVESFQFLSGNGQVFPLNLYNFINSE